MSSYDDWYPSNYFKADDAIDNPMDFTIDAIRPEKMQDGTSKPVVFFKEDKRGLVLNVTNKNFLVQLTRSKNPDDAVGQRVRMVAVEAEFQGKPCMALRLRRIPPAGEAALQSPPPKTPKPEPAKRGRPRKSTAEELSDTIPY